MEDWTAQIDNADGESPYPLGLHLSREAWRDLDLDAILVDPPGADPRRLASIAGQIALRVNERLGGDASDAAVRPGHLLTAGLVVDVLRYVFRSYMREQRPQASNEAQRALASALGSPEAAHRLYEVFADAFPPFAVAKGWQSPAAYLTGRPGAEPATHEALREIALLELASENPALRPFRVLFDDAALREAAPVAEAMEAVEAFYRDQPAVELVGDDLFATLRAPMRAAPDSLEGQLEYIRVHWGRLLPAWLIRRIIRTRDILREETRDRGFGKDVVEVLGFGRGLGGASDYPEPERFTHDAEWMSELVLIAKITYVWLDQLSRAYGRAIQRLDEVPDEELDLLARRGFTGLWLIGLWERSTASEEIKKRMGNAEAAASAYSLYDYTIAADLGGEAAYLRLKERAQRRGIRLASDMVPNHVGIFSRWVVEHPDWFIQCAEPPFPSYRFTGPDLSPDPRVAVQIEDGYWNHSDAAVVFKRVDTASGDTRYIYHGNDGTSMPWNDTAQLNYMLAEVREAVIQTILHVARLSPVIRFDAAMTLAKKHYQRLWFPLPGEGGAIPSRSLYSMTRQEFDRAMPEEFWREVVDRVQAEAPDTLLLAEAFWLMEGYFVRTLGMHRVYNSAFMNMLKMEENLKYRMTLKNVLEFSPEVLKRFVNFMNNPDELTAVEQFGRGDKFFGVSVMLATLPGLPMFGHGQVEGFTEKYGMEFRRAYWHETPDQQMVARHQREIAPLLRRRRLFCDVRHFVLYDLIHPRDYVDENVFVYSNRHGDERALVVYNNAYAPTRGRIHTSAAVNFGSAEDRDLRRLSLGEALGLRDDAGVFYLFRDARDGLHYIRRGASLAHEGMYFELAGYQYHVFLDFEEIVDTDHVWSRVCDRLNGRGVPDIERVFRETVLAPMLETFRLVLNPRTLTDFTRSLREPDRQAPVRRALIKALRMYLDVAESESGIAIDAEPALRMADRDLAAIQRIAPETGVTPVAAEGPASSAEARASASSTESRDAEQVAEQDQERAEVLFWRIPVTWALTRHLEGMLGLGAMSDYGAGWMDHWLLTTPIRQAYTELGRSEAEAHDDSHLIMLLVRHTASLLAAYDEEPAHFLEEILEDDISRAYLGVNEHEGRYYVRKEPFEAAMQWLRLTAAVAIHAEDGLEETERRALVASRERCVEAAIRAAEASGYDIGGMLDRLRGRVEEKVERVTPV